MDSKDYSAALMPGFKRRPQRFEGNNRNKMTDRAGYSVNLENAKMRSRR